jgi:antitoxin FitA
MGSLTIRKLDDDTKTRLRLSAAAKGISMEEEARRRLKESLTANGPNKPKLTVESLLQFGVKPDEPFDQKKASDEMWDEVLDSYRR